MSTVTQISLTIPNPVYHYLNTELERTGKSRSQIVSEILRAHFEPAEVTGTAETDQWLSEEVIRVETELDGRISRIERIMDEHAQV